MTRPRVAIDLPRRSYSSTFSPMPSPQTTRPGAIICVLAKVLATVTGSRSGICSTHEPMVIEVACEASAGSVDWASMAFECQRMWSASQSPSAPESSTRCTTSPTLRHRPSASWGNSERQMPRRGVASLTMAATLLAASQTPFRPKPAAAGGRVACPPWRPNPSPATRRVAVVVSRCPDVGPACAEELIRPRTPGEAAADVVVLIGAGAPRPTASSLDRSTTARVAPTRWPRRSRPSSPSTDRSPRWSRCRGTGSPGRWPARATTPRSTTTSPPRCPPCTGRCGRGPRDAGAQGRSDRRGQLHHLLVRGVVGDRPRRGHGRASSGWCARPPGSWRRRTSPSTPCSPGPSRPSTSPRSATATHAWADAVAAAVAATPVRRLGESGRRRRGGRASSPRPMRPTSPASSSRSMAASPWASADRRGSLGPSVRRRSRGTAGPRRRRR